MVLDLFVFLWLFVSALLFPNFGIVALGKKVQDLLFKSYQVFRAPGVSDHWKEKFLVRNSMRSLGVSLKMIFRIVAFLSVVIIPFLICELLFPQLAIFSYLVSLRGIIVSILPFLAYFLIQRVKTKSKKASHELL